MKRYYTLVQGPNQPIEANDTEVNGAKQVIEGINRLLQGPNQLRPDRGF